MEPIIRVASLTKNYKRFKNHKGYFGALQNLFDRSYDLIRAVDQISFEVHPGELVGYIGPNGAGKSTTIKMLTGLLVPTSGKLSVDGFVPWKVRKAYVKNIGAVFGQRTTLWWDLPLRDSLDLLKHIYQIPEETFKKNLGTFREILELDTFMDTPVRSLSLGQRMRADLCAALLHNPKLVFLDEPTIGLDVIAKQRMREFIQFINRDRGTTILLTTHDLIDVARLCKRVIIIDRGKILFDGKLADLLEAYGGRRLLKVEFAEDYPSPTLEDADIIYRKGLNVHYSFQRQTVSASNLIRRLSDNYRIQDLSVEGQPIEDTIRDIYENRLLHKETYGRENPVS